MYEIDLSNDIKQIELEINHHKNIAGQSIWEIGRRLKHVKDNNLTHGEFGNWVEKIGIPKTEASRFIKVADEIPNLGTFTNLGVKALYLIATLPEEEKQAQLERVEQGDNPTVRELQQLKRELNVARKANESLREKNEDLAEQILSKQETKIIEKEVVIEKVPDDYKATKKLNETLLNRNKELQQNYEDSERRKQFVENQLQKLYDEREQVDRESEKYRELTAAIEKSEGQLNGYQKKIASYKNFMAIFEKANLLILDVAGLLYVDEIKLIHSDPFINKEFNTLVDSGIKLFNDLDLKRKQTDILEGEIINE
ncbi:DUF3102 domain-containing protein [Streptococcus uberis]|uniref:DUF3102 domain-containing protein n=1 Tax=Streptococcus uberis TaxID=1349 RepID=UPI00193A4D15|nr:DUF3102 domain-containing protein [Streptococcus uberis]